jgi:hypothetical protein
MLCRAGADPVMASDPIDGSAKVRRGRWPAEMRTRYSGARGTAESAAMESAMETAAMETAAAMESTTAMETSTAMEASTAGRGEDSARVGLRSHRVLRW